jgi:hypothetical protein
MDWFRSKGTYIGTLALFALAVQLFVSLVHIHVDQLSDSRWASTVSLERSSGVETSPPINKSKLADGDVCALCSSVKLLVSTVLPLFVAVLLLIIVACKPDLIASSHSPNLFKITPFGPRGPPRA